MFLAALRAAGWRGPPPGSCGLTGRAMDDRSAGVLAGGAPTSDNLPDQFAIDRRATAWMARRCAVLGREARHIRAPVDPLRWGGSRARTPGSRLPHRAQTPGGRMPPMLRNPLRPGGPRKTNLATIRIAIEAAGRTPASMCNIRFRGSSRRTRRRCESLNADPMTSARRHDHLRTKRSRARMLGAAGG